MSNTRSNIIINVVQNFGKEQALIFAIYLTKRLVPNYAFFSEREKFGNVKILEKCIDIGFDYLSNIPFKNSTLNQLKKDLSNISPDSEDYPSVYSTFALDACIACDSIISIIQGNITEAIEISKVSINTVYIYVIDNIMETTGVLQDDDAIIMKSNYIIDELSFQESIIKKLLENDISQLIIEVTEFSMKSNIKLS